MDVAIAEAVVAAVDGIMEGGGRREEVVMHAAAILGWPDEMPEYVQRRLHETPNLAYGVRTILEEEGKIPEDMKEEIIYEARLQMADHVMSQGVIWGRAGEAPSEVQEVIQEARQRQLRRQLQQDALDGWVDASEDAD